MNSRLVDTFAYQRSSGSPSRIAARPLLRFVRLSSERVRQAVPQDCSFAEKQASPPALLVVVHSKSGAAQAPCSRFCLLFSPRPRAATVSNKAIGERLVVTEAAVRKHVGAIFRQA